MPVQWSIFSANMPDKDIAEYLAEHIEYHGPHVVMHFTAGSTHRFPVIIMAADHV